MKQQNVRRGGSAIAPVLQVTKIISVSMCSNAFEENTCPSFPDAFGRLFYILQYWVYSARIILEPTRSV